MAKISLGEVFGVSRNQVKSYYQRENVDGMFCNAIKSDKQIIVYGSSKQGKTALVDKYLPYTDNYVIRCTPKSELKDLYKSLIRQMNIQIVSETEKSRGTDINAKVKTKVRAILPFLGSSELSGEGGISHEKETKEISKTIEFNLELPQDISEIIKKIDSKKFIILENFHYLDDEIQQELSFDLRTFQELGVRFVVLGVWREKNRLTQFNGDLLDRIIEVPVEPWERKEFSNVIDKGSEILNIEITQELKDAIIENAFDSIGVVQEILRKICEKANIFEQQDQMKLIGDFALLRNAISEKADEYASRHTRALESIAEGRKKTKTRDGKIPLYLPYYTVKTFLKMKFNTIVSGIRREKLEEEIKKEHHRADEVRPSDMTNLLHNFAKLQSEKNIIPPIFDYDQSTKTMRIVDSTFYFYLRNINREEILRDIVNPMDVDVLKVEEEKVGEISIGEQIHEGTVKWFNISKGYGFIETEISKNVFVHFKDILGEGFKKLDEGEKVRLKIQKTEKGFNAMEVNREEVYNKKR